MDTSISHESWSNASVSTSEASSSCSTSNCNQAYENLHLVLSRLVRALHSHLDSFVPGFASSILVQPRLQFGGRFYPKCLEDDFRDYYLALRSGPRRKTQAHKYLGHVRIEGAVNYCFDRQKALNDRMFVRSLRRHASLHSHTDWRSVLSKHDKYATSGREEAKKIRRLERAFQAQGAWVRGQARHMANERQVCAHILVILADELNREELREIAIHDTDLVRAREAQIRAYTERAEAADRIIHVLQMYNLLCGTELADYLMHTCEQLRRHLGVQDGVDSYSQTLSSTEDSVETVRRPRSQKAAKTSMSQGSSASFGSPLSKAVPRRRTWVPKAAGPGRRNAHATNSNTSASQTTRRHFKNAGLRNNVRNGTEDDDASVLPSIVPLPRSYALSPTHHLRVAAKKKRKNSTGKPSRVTSYQADKILTRLADGKTDPVTGKLIKHDVPLFTRMTGSISRADYHPEARMWYSPVLGRSLARLVPVQEAHA